jgi:transcriptional regulator of arginine metabolism
MNKEKRQEAISEIIRSKRMGSQLQILKELEHLNIHASQSSLSRDFLELGVVKIKGVYQLPSIVTREVPLGEIMEIDTAGDNLIVVKTPPGQASMTALSLDNMKIPGVVGTVAGDDTFFVATKCSKEQKTVMRQILKIIKMIEEKR